MDVVEDDEEGDCDQNEKDPADDDHFCLVLVVVQLTAPVLQLGQQESIGEVSDSGPVLLRGQTKSHNV